MPEVATNMVAIGSSSNIGTMGPLDAAPASPPCPMRPPKSQGPLFLRRLSVVRPKRVVPRVVALGLDA